ncbi:DUF2750 domain-containing protein [Flavobacterium sp. xlx-214]|uniref:DUF2750 domain-containing protein n=1 Tax=unclassified Flavobacterium TaxID=196869 RepID=UPI0013D3B97F|nr:DUF2750 domain-containing protein [Flavobacterium sp. xlx-214]MBA5791870.1 DUF2750 domain-containing protein [Flavobacterium sp. xlx-221]QMI83107.1 DUF2750 domain-containing protein [Flavobacterium sp. xlx-214]
MIKQFINEIITSNEVFVVEHKGEVAVSQSVLFKNDDASPVNVICFWSSKEMAKNCCIEDWKMYKPQSICLATFLEDYLVQVYNESYIAGLNFNESMEGVEADPLDVILEIITVLKKDKISIELEYFKDINDLENQLRKLL